MSNFVRYIALALIIGLGAIFLIACDTQGPVPTQNSDCRVDEDNDSMDVLRGCSDDDENSVEIDD